MKKVFLTAVLLSFSASSAAGISTPPSGAKARSQQVNIKIGSATFTATLDDNPTARAFRALLPLTIKMTDLNKNEKYFDLLESLPTRASNPGTIQNGDLMLYGSRTLVLFYRTFPTSYSYTRLGRINAPKKLADVLGTGNVTVTFEALFRP